ncbi:MAG TPA: LacI family DNA-binding transcriptional regulator [Terriglobales bacterium]|nr:LacI family DNA-binding transcriptional regulator [Terriglobales bacterium]
MKAVRKRLPNRGQRVTLKFLAEYLELSPTTVSVVLNDSPLASTIAEKTKARVWEAVEKFQYRPNPFARYLQSKRTYNIGILVPEIGDEFSAMLISGIEEKLAEAKFNYFVESHGFAPEEVENYPDVLMDRQVEGMIFINTPLKKPMPVPVVAISDITQARGVTRVVIDNYQAMLTGIRHLKDLGHTRIAFFKGPDSNGDTEARWAAILRVAKAMGIAVKPELTATTGNYFEAGKLSMMERGYNAASGLLRRTRDFTALVAFNDGSAIGAIRAFQDGGLTVPDDISVMGMDDIHLAKFISPRLTTMRQPLKEMGGIAASTLLRRIHGERVPEETVAQPELVLRESTAAVRQQIENSRASLKLLF